MSYNVSVYRRQGGAALVVGSGGKIVMQTGGQIVPNSETQAAHIATVTGAVTVSAAGTIQPILNSILVALEGVGILATS